MVFGKFSKFFFVYHRDKLAKSCKNKKVPPSARAAGTLPLREAALALVAAGGTTLEEANRVTFVA
jgi:type II secretory ATPase GspE/PulE/Tfp pilus assembly ATPase PilB-like protein